MRLIKMYTDIILFLGNHMNIFLNENWRELYDEMQSAFEQALSSAFIGIIQQFLNQVPLNQIFNH